MNKHRNAFYLRIKYLIIFLSILSLSAELSYAQCDTGSVEPYAIGRPGEMLYAGAKIFNTSPKYKLNFIFKRAVNNLPIGWNACFCLPYCTTLEMDSVVFQLAPGDSIDVSIGCVTDSTANIGKIKCFVYEAQKPEEKLHFDLTFSTLSVGLKDSKTQTISAYPNPATDYLNVNLPSGFEPDKIAIHDMNGKIVSDIFPSALIKDHRISLPKLNSGIYFLIIENENQRFISKFIKTNNNG